MHLNSSPKTNQAAFTLADLVVCLAVVALLTLILAPGMAATGPRSGAFQCLNNLRQLQIAWSAYSADYNDAICPNPGFFTGSPSSWVLGNMSVPAQQTNTSLIKQGILWPYIQSLSVYRCPDDPSKSTTGAPRVVRSISMNGWMNPITPWNATHRSYVKQSDLINPKPSNCWVIIDENSNSINDGQFTIDPGTSLWIDIPAGYHNRSAAISFADGRAELKQWTYPVILGGPLPTSPDAASLAWLQARSTSLK